MNYDLDMPPYDVKQDTKWTCPCCTAEIVNKHKMFRWVAKIKEVRVCLPCLSIVSLLDKVEW